MAERASEVEIHCLHGTFQSPAAWEGPAAALTDRLAKAGRRARVVAHPVEPGDATDPSAWASSWLGRLPAGGPADGAKQVLLGYSLGGRLGLHALLAAPDRWVAAVLVAAHPGEADAAARAEIARRDAGWAARCRKEAWDALLADWDRLPVFGGRPNAAPRDEAVLDRARWAAAFERLSRGRQEDLRGPLSGALAAGRLPPILYVTGEADEKYRALGDELAGLGPGLRHATIAGAGHRVPWERPAGFARVVAAFLDEVIPRPAPPPRDARG